MKKTLSKKFYKICAIFQVLFAVFVIAMLFPSFLNFGFSADILKWREFTEKIFLSDAGRTVSSVLHGIVLLLFVTNFFCLFFWKGFSNFFFKLSTAVSIFPFAVFALERILLNFGHPTTILSFSKTLQIVLACVAGALFVLAFVLFLVEIKHKKTKTTTFLVAKSFLWFVLILMNFVVFSNISAPNWFEILFFYDGILSPFFLIWLLPVLAVWQFVSGVLMGRKD